jgi:hypothetical protein
LDEEHRTKLVEVTRLDEDAKQTWAERNAVIPRIEQTYTLVEELTDADLEPVQITAAEPMPSLRLLLDVFCLLLDRPAAYHRAGQKLLTDPMFIQTVAARVAAGPPSPEVVDNIETYFQMEALSPMEFEAIAPVLRVLYDWIKAICRAAILGAELASLKIELEEKQRQLSEYAEEMVVEKASVQQVEASLVAEKQALESSAAAREKMEQEFHGLDSRKKAVDSIFNGINFFMRKWQSDISCFTGREQAVIAGSIIFAF